MRIIGISALAMAMLAGLSAPQAKADDIRVTVNGDPINFAGAQPRQVNGRVLVPLRGVLEKMGAVVDWDAASQTVTATKGSLDLSLPIGSRSAKINERTVQLDVPAQTMGGYTMVPLRFVSEALGADVSWSNRDQTVMITTDQRYASNDRRFRRDPGVDPNQNPPDRPNPGRRFSRVIALPAGTVIPVRLDEALRSNEAREGDRFTATIEAGRDDAGLPSGTKFEGIVREAIPARGGKPGVLDFDFRKVIFPDGTEKTIQAHTTGLDNKYVTRDSSGRLIAKGGGNGNERLKWVGIGAGAGLLLSTVTKGNTLLDTLLGGGAGYLYNELQHKGAKNVDLKADTEVGVKLDQSMSFRPGNG